MKITETKTRECCQDIDFRPLYGNRDSRRVFCVVCGKRWKREYFTDAAGSRDYRYIVEDGEV